MTATEAQLSYIKSLIGDGITVRGVRITRESNLSRLTVAQASAMIDELKSLGRGRTTTTTPAVATGFGSPTKCHFCGGTWAVTKVSDMSGLTGYVCGHHSRDFAEGLGCFA